MITEERQRKVYEWGLEGQQRHEWELEPPTYNSRLKRIDRLLAREMDGHTWRCRLCNSRVLSPSRGQRPPATFCHEQPLYVRDSEGNWHPNYQWFFTVAVPQLVGEGIEVYFSSPTYLSQGYVLRLAQRPKDGKVLVREDTRDVPDPIAALAEYVESLEVAHD